MPAKISKETIVRAEKLLECANKLQFDIGAPFGREDAGDCCWFLLTNAEPSWHYTQSMYILIATPSSYFGNYNSGSDFEYSCIDDEPEDLLLHLIKMGYRKLTEEEKKDFLSS